jgi:hypothetical protein
MVVTGCGWEGRSEARSWVCWTASCLPRRGSAYRASGDARLATLISDLLDEESRTEGEAYDVLLLTGIDDPRTIRLQAPVANDTVTESGKP